MIHPISRLTLCLAGFLFSLASLVNPSFSLIFPLLSASAILFFSGRFLSHHAYFDLSFSLSSSSSFFLPRIKDPSSSFQSFPIQPASHSFIHSFIQLLARRKHSFILFYSFTHSCYNCLYLSFDIPLHWPIRGSCPATTIAIHLHSPQAKPLSYSRFQNASWTAHPPASRRSPSRELAFHSSCTPL